MSASGRKYSLAKKRLAVEEGRFVRLPEPVVKALIPFAPGAMSWQRSDLLQFRLKRAVDQAKAPIFLLQAANDYSLGPAHELSREAERKHIDFRSKIYPPVGDNAHDGHAKFCMSATIWGDDVLAFLKANMHAAQ